MSKRIKLSQDGLLLTEQRKGWAFELMLAHLLFQNQYEYVDSGLEAM